MEKYKSKYSGKEVDEGIEIARRTASETHSGHMSTTDKMIIHKLNNPATPQSDGYFTKEDKSRLDNLYDLDKNFITLNVHGWNESTHKQHIIVGGFNPEEDILFVSPVPFDAVAYRNYGIVVVSEEVNGITFYAEELPEIPIQINIIRGHK